MILIYIIVGICLYIIFCDMNNKPTIFTKTKWKMDEKEESEKEEYQKYINDPNYECRFKYGVAFIDYMPVINKANLEWDIINKFQDIFIPWYNSLSELQLQQESLKLTLSSMISNTHPYEFEYNGNKIIISRYLNNGPMPLLAPKGFIYFGEEPKINHNPFASKMEYTYALNGEDIQCNDSTRIFIYKLVHDPLEQIMSNWDDDDEKLRTSQMK